MLTQTRVAQARTGRSNWTALPFGKHQGKTLPEVLFHDPDWFFWAAEKEFLSGRLRTEAEMLFYRATNIKIPGNPDAQLEAEYDIDPTVNRLSGLRIVTKQSSLYAGSSHVRRSDRIDMSAPRRLSSYDKKGNRIFLRACKHCLFGDRDLRLTRQDCEDFFSDPHRFV